MDEPTGKPDPAKGWLNRTVLGIGAASLFSDVSHEIATSVMPQLVAGIVGGHRAPVFLGVIEGVADGLASFTKLFAGWYTDRLRRRKPIAATGYLITAISMASFALATRSWHLILARSIGWFG